MSDAILSLKSKHQLTMVDQVVKIMSNPVFSCDVCGKTCLNQNALTKHKNSLGAHEGLRRNEKNEIEFVCSVCEKVYRSRTGLYGHQYAKHRASVNVSMEATDEVMETTSAEKKRTRVMVTKVMTTKYPTKKNVLLRFQHQWR